MLRMAARNGAMIKGSGADTTYRFSAILLRAPHATHGGSERSRGRRGVQAKAVLPEELWPARSAVMRSR